MSQSLDTAICTWKGICWTIHATQSSIWWEVIPETLRLHLGLDSVSEMAVSVPSLAPAGGKKRNPGKRQLVKRRVGRASWQDAGSPGKAVPRQQQDMSAKSSREGLPVDLRAGPPRVPAQQLVSPDWRLVAPCPTAPPPPLKEEPTSRRDASILLAPSRQGPAQEAFTGIHFLASTSSHVHLRALDAKPASAKLDQSCRLSQIG